MHLKFNLFQLTFQTIASDLTTSRHQHQHQNKAKSIEQREQSKKQLQSNMLNKMSSNIFI
jgi:single-stranded DNA-specific DHH superfamily exonuclease